MSSHKEQKRRRGNARRFQHLFLNEAERNLIEIFEEEDKMSKYLEKINRFTSERNLDNIDISTNYSDFSSRSSSNEEINIKNKSFEEELNITQKIVNNLTLFNGSLTPDSDDDRRFYNNYISQETEFIPSSLENLEALNKAAKLVDREFAEGEEKKIYEQFIKRHYTNKIIQPKEKSELGAKALFYVKEGTILIVSAGVAVYVGYMVATSTFLSSFLLGSNLNLNTLLKQNNLTIIMSTFTVIKSTLKNYQGKTHEEAFKNSLKTFIRTGAEHGIKLSNTILIGQIIKTRQFEQVKTGILKTLSEHFITMETDNILYIYFGSIINKTTLHISRDIMNLSIGSVNTGIQQLSILQYSQTLLDKIEDDKLVAEQKKEKKEEEERMRQFMMELEKIKYGRLSFFNKLYSAKNYLINDFPKDHPYIYSVILIITCQAITNSILPALIGPGKPPDSIPEAPANLPENLKPGTELPNIPGQPVANSSLGQQQAANSSLGQQQAANSSLGQQQAANSSLGQQQAANSSLGQQTANVVLTAASAVKGELSSENKVEAESNLDKFFGSLFTKEFLLKMTSEYISTEVKNRVSAEVLKYIPLKNAVMSFFQKQLNIKDDEFLTNLDKNFMRRLFSRALFKNILYYLTNVAVSLTQQELLYTALDGDKISQIKNIYNNIDRVKFDAIRDNLPPDITSSQYIHVYFKIFADLANNVDVKIDFTNSHEVAHYLAHMLSGTTKIFNAVTGESDINLTDLDRDDAKKLKDNMDKAYLIYDNERKRLESEIRTIDKNIAFLNSDDRSNFNDTEKARRDELVRSYMEIKQKYQTQMDNLEDSKIHFASMSQFFDMYLTGFKTRKGEAGPEVISYKDLKTLAKAPQSNLEIPDKKNVDELIDTTNKGVDKLIKDNIERNRKIAELNGTLKSFDPKRDPSTSSNSRINNMNPDDIGSTNDNIKSLMNKKKELEEQRIQLEQKKSLLSSVSSSDSSADKTSIDRTKTEIDRAISIIDTALGAIDKEINRIFNYLGETGSINLNEVSEKPKTIIQTVEEDMKKVEEASIRINTNIDELTKRDRVKTFFNNLIQDSESSQHLHSILSRNNKLLSKYIDEFTDVSSEEVNKKIKQTKDAIEAEKSQKQNRDYLSNAKAQVEQQRDVISGIIPSSNSNSELLIATTTSINTNIDSIESTNTKINTYVDSIFKGQTTTVTSVQIGQEVKEVEEGSKKINTNIDQLTTSDTVNKFFNGISQDSELSASLNRILSRNNTSLADYISQTKKLGLSSEEIQNRLAMIKKAIETERALQLSLTILLEQRTKAEQQQQVLDSMRASMGANNQTGLVAINKAIESNKALIDSSIETITTNVDTIFRNINRGTITTPDQVDKNSKDLITKANNSIKPIDQQTKVVDKQIRNINKNLKITEFFNNITSDPVLAQKLNQVLTRTGISLNEFIQNIRDSPSDNDIDYTLSTIRKGLEKLVQNEYSYSDNAMNIARIEDQNSRNLLKVRDLKRRIEAESNDPSKNPLLTPIKQVKKDVYQINGEVIGKGDNSYRKQNENNWKGVNDAVDSIFKKINGRESEDEIKKSEESLDQSVKTMAEMGDKISKAQREVNDIEVNLNSLAASIVKEHKPAEKGKEKTPEETAEEEKKIGEQLDNVIKRKLVSFLSFITHNKELTSVLESLKPELAEKVKSVLAQKQELDLALLLELQLLQAEMYKLLQGETEEGNRLLANAIYNADDPSHAELPSFGRLTYDLNTFVNGFTANAVAGGIGAVSVGTVVMPFVTAGAAAVTSLGTAGLAGITAEAAVMASPAAFAAAGLITADEMAGTASTSSAASAAAKMVGDMASGAVGFVVGLMKPDESSSITDFATYLGSNSRAGSGLNSFARGFERGDEVRDDIAELLGPGQADSGSGNFNFASFVIGLGLTSLADIKKNGGNGKVKNVFDNVAKEFNDTDKARKEFLGSTFEFVENGHRGMNAIKALIDGTLGIHDANNIILIGEGKSSEYVKDSTKDLSYWQTFWFSYVPTNWSNKAGPQIPDYTERSIGYHTGKFFEGRDICKTMILLGEEAAAQNNNAQLYDWCNTDRNFELLA